MPKHPQDNSHWTKTTLVQAAGLTVAGASAAVATDAVAQDNHTPVIRLTHYNMDMESSIEGKYPGSDGLDDAKHAYRIDLTVPVDEQWDARISYNTAEGTSRGFSYFSYPFYSAIDPPAQLDYNTLDFEAGYHTTLGNQPVRLFAGLRYMDLDQTNTLGYGLYYSKYGGPESPLFSVRYQSKSELKAIGVRAGAETTRTLNERFSVSGLLAANVMHGKRETDFNFTYSKYGTPMASYSDNTDDHGTWYGIETELALNWDPTPGQDGAIVSLGYTWARDFDVLAAGLDGSQETDLTRDGWFVRLQASF